MNGAALTEAQQQRIARALGTVPFGKLLGFKLDAVQPGEATLSLEIRDELKQNNGVVHGGAIASLIDSATAFSIITLLEEHERITTVDLTINYLRPLITGTITAKARVLRLGGRVIATTADVFDSAGNLAATALSTYVKISSAPGSPGRIS